jgi:hypothetical protein
VEVSNSPRPDIIRCAQDDNKEAQDENSRFQFSRSALMSTNPQGILLNVIPDLIGNPEDVTSKTGFPLSRE